MRWFADWRLVTTLLVAFLFFLFPGNLSGKSNWKKHELFDVISRLHENDMRGNAPPVVLLTFDKESRASYWKRHRPNAAAVEWPAVMPLDVLKKVMAGATNACIHPRPQEEACPTVIIVDVDIWPAGAQRDPKEIAEFTATLRAWASNRKLPLIVFVRAPTERPALEKKEPHQFELGSAPPWDDIVAHAENITWASGLAKVDDDAVVRQFAYFSCVYPENGTTAAPLPHAALFALAAATAPSAGKAKAMVWPAMTKNLCTVSPPENARFQLQHRGSKKPYSFDGQFGLIVYHLNGDAAAAGPAPVIPYEGPWKGLRTITTLPETILEEPRAGLGFAKNAIVLISAEEPSFEDTHWTPYGPQPGALVLANAARGLIVEGPTEYLSDWLRLFVMIATAFLVHACITLAEFGHKNALIKPDGKKTRLGDFTRIATSRVGAVLLVGAIVSLAEWLLGLVMPSLGIWQTAAVAFIIAATYLFLDELDDAYEGHKDVLHR